MRLAKLTQPIRAAKALLFSRFEQQLQPLFDEEEVRVTSNDLCWCLLAATAEAVVEKELDEDLRGRTGGGGPTRDLFDTPPMEDDGLREVKLTSDVLLETSSEAFLCHSSTNSLGTMSSSLFSNPEAGGNGELNAGGGVAAL